MRPGFLLLASISIGCASTIDGTGGPDGGPGARVDGANRDGGGADVRDVPYFDTSAYEVFREDACPGTRPPAQRAYECDPLAGGECPAGEGCYAFVEYPTARCGSETYRARCFEVGTTAPGEFCRGGTECAAGAGCFVTGAMNRCLRLCRLDGAEPRCQRGTVCEPTDLPDFGACE
ncbi:MAG: uncharacterized protein JWM10_3794 [Myxococcaceae bacterium]|nr:uncharacterized protein [Myxococcaceae bacterium]